MTPRQALRGRALAPADEAKVTALRLREEALRGCIAAIQDAIAAAPTIPDARYPGGLPGPAPSYRAVITVGDLAFTYTVPAFQALAFAEGQLATVQNELQWSFGQVVVP